MKLAGGKHRDNMSTKDVFENGNAAMKEAALKSLSTEAADSAESTARRTARAGARRELCVLNGQSSTKVGLDCSLDASERNPMCERCARVAPPETESGQTLGCRGRRRLLWRAGSTAGLKAGSPIACATGHAATGVTILSLF